MTEKNVLVVIVMIIIVIAMLLSLCMFCSTTHMCMYTRTLHTVEGAEGAFSPVPCAGAAPVLALAPTAVCIAKK